MRTCVVFGVLLAFMLIATSASAVDIMLGFKGGLNISNMTGDDIDSEGLDNRLGFIGGVSVDFKLHEMLSIQPELIYTMKGFSVTEGDIEGGWKVQYLQLPVLLKLHVPASEIVDPSIYVGPAIGGNAISKVVATRGATSAEQDISGVTKDAEFSIIIGGGLGIKAGEKGAFIIDLRYDYGLTSLDDVGDEDIKNWAFGVMLGYGIKF